jgi:uncharacterized repeat protein (TIGR01451 family)
MLSIGSKLKLALLCALLLLTEGVWAATCFAFDDTSGSLVVFDQSAPLTVRKSVPIPGGFGGDLVEAAYFDGINNRYYLIRQGAPNTLGYVNPLTDTYVAVSPAAGLGTTAVPTAVSVGTGNGGTRITGLARNPITNKWYVARIDGYLFEINPSTGVFVPGAFGGNDYLRLRDNGGTLITVIEDLVFDAAGRLFATTGTVLHQNFNLTTGYAASQVAMTGFAEGMTLDQDGTVRVVMGANTGATSRNVYTLNTTTGATTLLYNLPDIGGAADYESIGCNPFPERSDLQLSKSASPGSVIPGGTATFTLGLFNGGVDPAFRVNVLDAIPAGMTVLSSSIQGTCSSCAFDPLAGLWSIDQILFGQRLTLSFVVSTSGATPNSTVANRAQVTQACTRATGPCIAMPDPDSTPNNKAGAYTPSEDDEAIASLLLTPTPSVSKSFNPSSGDPGNTTLLVLTLSNPNTTVAATLTAALTDTYPAGMVNGPIPNPQTTCGGAGALVAAAGANSITVPAGRVIAVAGSCTVSVVVQLLNQGSYNNLVPAGALVTTAGNSIVGVTATYVAPALNVSVVKSFVPNAIGTGQTVTLRLSLSNPSSVTATLTSALVDTYPAGLVNAATPNPQTSCAGAGAPVATAGGNSLTVPAGRAIAPNSSCTVTAVVTAASVGLYTNTIAAGELLTTAGSNFSTATDSLLVDRPRVEKYFTPSAVQAGVNSQLRIVFINPLPLAANLTALFTDIYPTGIVNAPTPGATDTCGGGNPSATAGLGTVTMPVGTVIPAQGQCELTVNVRGAANGVYVNSIPAGSLSTSLGASSSAVTATLTISTLADIRVTKVASLLSATPSQTVSFTVTVSNLGPSTATAAPFTDVLNGFTIVGAVTRTVAGGATVTALTTSTTAINATLTLPLNSTVNFIVAAVPSQFSGIITNTAAVGVSANYTDPNPTNNTASVPVTISKAASLSVSKTDGLASASSGQTVNYTLIFANAGPSPADGAIVKDTPSAGLNCISLVCTPTGGASCGAMTVSTLTSAGGHILPSLPSGSNVTVVLSCQVTAMGL